MQIRCPKCNTEKDSALFTPAAERKNGFRSRCTACSLVDHSGRARARKQEGIDYLGGACMSCGAKGLHPASYDFHHRDPSTKDREFRPQGTYAFERMKIELDKCDLLCRNCHSAFHAKY